VVEAAPGVGVEAYVVPSVPIEANAAMTELREMVAQNPKNVGGFGGVTDGQVVAVHGGAA
jgi:hypothetical protein